MAIQEKTIEAFKPGKPKKIKHRNTLLTQCLISVALTCLTGAGAITGIFLTTANQIQNLSTENQLELASNGITALIQQRLSIIQSQLNLVAKNDDVYNALVLNDNNKRQALEDIYLDQFQYAESLHLIPWNKFGTAGIKHKEIILRNNIETMLITRAGAKDTPKPEIYEVGKQWLISFVAPISRDDTVIGIALVSIKGELFDAIFNKENSIATLGEINISREGSQRNIFETGSGNSAKSLHPLPFNGGMFSLKLQNNTAQSFIDALNIIYAAIAGIIVLINLLFFAIYRYTIFNIHQDCDNILQYIQSLNGLHESKKPDLNFHSLQKVVDPLAGLVGSGRSAVIANNNTSSPQPRSISIPKALDGLKKNRVFEYPEIFRDYDIRGLANTQLSDENSKLIGQAIGSEAASIKQECIVLGYDSRDSSPRISQALIEGITSAGCNVITLGKVTTPMTYFASSHLETNAAIMVTGSHNGEDHNGIKLILNGKSLVGMRLKIY